MMKQGGCGSANVKWEIDEVVDRGKNSFGNNRP